MLLSKSWSSLTMGLVCNSYPVTISAAMKFWQNCAIRRWREHPQISPYHVLPLSTEAGEGKSGAAGATVSASFFCSHTITLFLLQFVWHSRLVSSFSQVF